MPSKQTIHCANQLACFKISENLRDGISGSTFFLITQEKKIEDADGEWEKVEKQRRTDLPTVMSSPIKIEPNTTVNATDNGLNMGGYDGPFLATAQEFKQYFPAVASAPCTKRYSVILFFLELV